MKKFLVYACEGTYGGLHRINDMDIIEEEDCYSEDDIWGMYIPDMSYELMERWGMTDKFYEEAEGYYKNDSDSDSLLSIDEMVEDIMGENVEGYVREVHSDLSLETLREELVHLGDELFRKKYCKSKEN